MLNWKSLITLLIFSGAVVTHERVPYDLGKDFTFQKNFKIETFLDNAIQNEKQLVCIKHFGSIKISTWLQKCNNSLFFEIIDNGTMVLKYDTVETLKAFHSLPALCETPDLKLLASFELSAMRIKGIFDLYQCYEDQTYDFMSNDSTKNILPTKYSDETFKKFTVFNSINPEEKKQDVVFVEDIIDSVILGSVNFCFNVITNAPIIVIMSDVSGYNVTVEKKVYESGVYEFHRGQVLTMKSIINLTEAHSELNIAVVPLSSNVTGSIVFYKCATTDVPINSHENIKSKYIPFSQIFNNKKVYSFIIERPLTNYSQPIDLGELIIRAKLQPKSTLRMTISVSNPVMVSLSKCNEKKRRNVISVRGPTRTKFFEEAISFLTEIVVDTASCDLSIDDSTIYMSVSSNFKTFGTVEFEWTVNETTEVEKNIEDLSNSIAFILPAGKRFARPLSIGEMLDDDDFEVKLSLETSAPVDIFVSRCQLSRRFLLLQNVSTSIINFDDEIRQVVKDVKNISDCTNFPTQYHSKQNLFVHVVAQGSRAEGYLKFYAIREVDDAMTRKEITILSFGVIGMIFTSASFVFFLYILYQIKQMVLKPKYQLFPETY